MAVLDQVGDHVEEMINAQGRSRSHVLEGMAVCAGALVLSALVTARSRAEARDPVRRAEAAALETARDTPPKSALAEMWPTLVLGLTVSGLRIWNAPASAARSRALGLWVAIQALNALWMSWTPRQQTGQLATSVLTLGVGAAYANEARKVDGAAAALVSPFLGWSSVVSLVAGRFWRRSRNAPGVR